MVGITRSVMKVVTVAATLLGAGGAYAQESKSYSGGSRPSVLWAKGIGNIDVAEDEIDGISVDNNGNTVIAGVFRDKIALGNKTYSSVGGDDIFLASYNRNGQLNWSKTMGSAGLDNTFDVTTDASGNVYMSGWFSGTVDFGGDRLKSRGSTDMFIAKYSPDGALLWARNFGGTKGDGGNEIAVTAGGQIAVSMITEGDVAIGGKTYQYGGGSRDALVIRMTPRGDVLWVAQAKGSGTERIRAMAISPEGDVYVGFQFHKQLRLYGADGQSMTNEGMAHWDGALARLDPNGKLQWLKPVMSGDNDNVRGIGVGSNNEIYASGKIQNSAQVVDRTIKLPEQYAGDNKGIDYVLKVNKAGEFQWIVGMRSGIEAVGGELQAYSGGVITSALQKGGANLFRVDAGNKGATRVGSISVDHTAPMAYAMGLTPAGNLRFSYVPSPTKKRSGSFGDVLSLSRDGRYLAQSLRFRDSISVAGTEMDTPSKKDSAIVFMQLN